MHRRQPFHADEPMRQKTVGICHLCKHRDPDGIRCTAFPDGIPLAVLMGKLDHHKPVPGDHGIQFAPKPPTSTAGAVSYCMIYGASGKAEGALWVGDDGSADYMGEPERVSVWRGMLALAYQHGTEPYDFLVYWANDGGNGITWSAGALNRAASLDVLAERLANERGA